MIDEKVSRRLLLIAQEPMRSVWRAMLPSDWEVGVAASVEHARMVQRVGACDIVLLSSDHLDAGDLGAADRLFVKDGSPVVLVAERPDERVFKAVRAGAIWLPSTAARGQPAFLEAVLDQAIPRAKRIASSCGCHCQARVDRLLELLWQASPGNGPGPWFSQRHMLERLDEEVSRTQRDGAPLSVILGEVRLKDGYPLASEPVAKLHQWAASQIAMTKRRGDVARQYGLDGFMLVLPRSTPEQAKGACLRLR